MKLMQKLSMDSITSAFFMSSSEHRNMQKTYVLGMKNAVARKALSRSEMESYFVHINFGGIKSI